MNIILLLVLGLVAGVLASLIMKTEHGTLLDIVLGVVGSFVGGFLFNMFGAAGVTGFNLYSLVVATIGAVVLIALGRLINRQPL